jgi:hypothetical protein
MAGHGGGYRVAEMRALEREAVARTPLAVRCSLCPWSFEGTTEVALAMGRAHRAEHGLVVKRYKRAVREKVAA